MFQIQVLRLKCKLKVTVNCFTYLIQFLFLFVFFPTVHDLFFNGPRYVYQRSAICFDLRNNIGRQIRSTTYLNSVGMYTSLSLFGLPSLYQASQLSAFRLSFLVLLHYVWRHCCCYKSFSRNPSGRCSSSVSDYGGKQATGGVHFRFWGDDCTLCISVRIWRYSDSDTEMYWYHVGHKGPSCKY